MTDTFNNHEVEQYVIGAAFNDPEAATTYIVDEQIREDHFSTLEHRTLWRFVAHYLEHGSGPLTSTVLASHLQSVPTLVVGGLSVDVVVEAAGFATRTADADHANPEHARILRDAAERRRLAGLLRTGHQDLQRPDVTPEDIIARVTSEIAEGQLDRDPRLSAEAIDGASLDEVIDRVIPEIESDETPSFIPTGLGSLDALIGGVTPGELTVIGARPAQGKSVLGLMLSRQVVQTTAGHVVHWSFEMTANELAKRYIAMTGAAPLAALTKRDRRAWLSIDWSAVLDIPREPASRLRIMNRPDDVTAAEIVRHAKRYSDRHGPLSLLVVDYVGLLAPVNPRHDDRQKITDASRRLKQLAMALRIPVVLLSQLSRKGDDRANKRPMMSDLKESGSLEEDADHVILIHRPSTYDKLDRPGEADLIVVKNRAGAEGDAVVNFDGPYVRFENRTAYYTDVPLPGRGT